MLFSTFFGYFSLALFIILILRARRFSVARSARREPTRPTPRDDPQAHRHLPRAGTHCTSGSQRAQGGRDARRGRRPTEAAGEGGRHGTARRRSQGRRPQRDPPPHTSPLCKNRPNTAPHKRSAEARGGEGGQRAETRARGGRGAAAATQHAPAARAPNYLVSLPLPFFNLCNVSKSMIKGGSHRFAM